MNKFYRDYADFLGDYFPGKMQKLTVDAGFTCPNRDGTVGRGGCSYCNNASFSPLAGGSRGSVEAQLEAGKRFFSRKYPEMRYLAYFQSYTSTHGDRNALLDLYHEALGVDKVDGLIIGTRPDCVDKQLLDDLAAIGKPVFMEYGAESSYNSTLEAVNRCHTWEQTVEAVEITVACGLPVGLHFIMGLPGESREMMLETVRSAATLPLATLKFHQLQIIRGTRMAKDFLEGKLNSVTLFSPEEYISLCKDIVALISELNSSIAIERFTSSAPPELLLAPRWGIKNYEFTHRLQRELHSMSD
ncbi:MAG: TIGR01212 family radical SAM protein [Bacteroidales bacterium]|nr:TIGR01212 family radical SAM protein [Bacteroidales bacterium]